MRYAKLREQNKKLAVFFLRNINVDLDYQLVMTLQWTLQIYDVTSPDSMSIIESDSVTP